MLLENPSNYPDMFELPTLNDAQVLAVIGTHPEEFFSVMKELEPYVLIRASSTQLEIKLKNSYVDLDKLQATFERLKLLGYHPEAHNVIYTKPSGEQDIDLGSITITWEEQVKSKGIIMSFTERGFIVGYFNDIYGAECSIQESSLADKPAIWLGINCPEIKVMSVDAKDLPPPVIVPDEGSGEDYGWCNYTLPDKVHSFSRMHLDIDMAKELVKQLQYFIETGKLQYGETKES